MVLVSQSAPKKAPEELLADIIVRELESRTLQYIDGLPDFDADEAEKEELRAKVAIAAKEQDLRKLTRLSSSQTFGAAVQEGFSKFALACNHAAYNWKNSRTPDLDECAYQIEVKAANLSGLKKKILTSGVYIANNISDPGTGIINRVLLVQPDEPASEALIVEGTTEQLSDMVERLMRVPTSTRRSGLDLDRKQLHLSYRQVETMRENPNDFPELMTFEKFALKLNSCTECVC